MNLLRCILLLGFATALALGQAARQARPASPANQPEALVRSLYQQVMTRQPVSIPEEANMKILAPFLSKALLHRIDLAIACLDDWYRQNPERQLKPEIGWLELGYFSGENERASPQTFQIERTQSEKDGSFRVYVRLTRAFSTDHTSTWRVAAIVKKENGHFVVNDVIYFKDDVRDVEGRLSEALSAGCDGPRWVGFGSQQNSLKQQR